MFADLSALRGERRQAMIVMDFYLTFSDDTLFEIIKGGARVYGGYLSFAPISMMDFNVLESHVNHGVRDTVILLCE